VTDFLDQKRQEITDRLNVLRPALDEYHQLEAAAAALSGVGGQSAPAAPTAPTPRRRGRPPGSGRKKAAPTTPVATPAKPAKAPKAAKVPKAAKKAGRRAGRRKGSGNRAAEAQGFVNEQPGITIPELAVKMGIKQNYLYRVLPGLEQESKVQKKGRGWFPHPKAAAKAAA
jgi:hypothetical protein